MSRIPLIFHRRSPVLPTRSYYTPCLFLPFLALTAPFRALLAPSLRAYLPRCFRPAPTTKTTLINRTMSYGGGGYSSRGGGGGYGNDYRSGGGRHGGDYNGHG